MSTMRNAAPRRTHRERAQPHSREKHGLLEKHKDYSARARDYNAKKARLKILREKAQNRNPDEFAFAMMSSKTTDGGVKVTERSKAKGMDAETVKLLKTQDAGYLRVMSEQARREREKLEEVLLVKDGDEKKGRPEKLVVLGGNHDGTSDTRHTVFVEDEDSQRNFDPEDWFDTDSSGLQKVFNRPRRGTGGNATDSTTGTIQKKKTQRELEQEHQAWKNNRAAQKKHLLEQERLVKRLEAVKAREKQLHLAERELEEQRAKMSNSTGGVNKNGVKFKVRQRKR